MARSEARGFNERLELEPPSDGFQTRDPDGFSVIVVHCANCEAFTFCLDDINDRGKAAFYMPRAFQLLAHDLVAL